MNADSQWPSLGTRRNQLLATLLLMLVAGSWIATAELRSRMGTGGAAGDAAVQMPAIGDMSGMANASWSPGHASLVLLTWAAMMAAMMVPVAAPFMLSDAQAAARGANRWTFLFGYLAVWTGASAVATGMQWGLERAALLSPETMALRGAFAPAILIVAGVYQWTLPKDVCLARCCAANVFDSPRADSAFLSGVRHGVACLGCCWALMLLMFAGAMQSLLWMAALMVFIILERTLPNPRAVARGAGAAAILAGLLWLAGPMH